MSTDNITAFPDTADQAESITQAEQRPFRVSLRNTVELDVEVEAATIEEARAKALEWYPYDGHQEISGYWNGEDFISEPSTMYWEINDVNFEIISVEEVETEATE